MIKFVNTKNIFTISFVKNIEENIIFIIEIT